MLSKNLKTAFRFLLKDKFYSLINIVGLSSGIAIAILILMFINDEFSYDKHYTKFDRIHRIESNFKPNTGNEQLFAMAPLPLGPTMMDEFPEIENCVRFVGIQVEDILFKYGENEFYEDSMYFVDSTVFDLFDHKFVFGNPENSLSKPRTMVISYSMAKRYFKDEDPIGKVIQTSNFGDYEVTAVIEDVPGNSHLKFNCLLSVASLVDMVGAANFNSRAAPGFWSPGAYTFILLKENTSIEQIHNKFPELYTKYMEEMGKNINYSFSLLSTPLSETHFSSDEPLQFDLPVGNSQYALIFSFVALFILVIACINYMNMATARSSNRSREVGVKKVIGAHRGSIISQFIGESTLFSFVSLVVSIILVAVLLPVFNNLSGKDLIFNNMLTSKILLGVALIFVFVSFLSGSYPAFYLSSFVPQKVLKTATGSGKNKGLLRKILVVIQFSISLIMIIGTLIVSKQQKFIAKSDLGFNKENVIIIPARDTSFFRRIRAFREELIQNVNIEYVATANQTPTTTIQGKTIFNVDINGEMTDQTLNLAVVDFDYIKLMEIRIIAGRDFDRTISTDTLQGFIVNNAFVRSNNWTPEEAVGKRIRTGGFGVDDTFARDGFIIGVIKDYHYSSLHNVIESFVLLLTNQPLPNIHIKFASRNHESALEFIKEKRREFNVNTPFNYYYLDDRIDAQYTSEKNLGVLFTIFSILTILISCMGLLGLSAFVTQQRTREIGIRKVLGSSNKQIISLMVKNFIQLVCIAIVIAIWPAYNFMSKWIQDFAYQTNIGILPFVIGGVLVIVIALITVGFHAVRASNTNPAESLKHE